MYELLTEIAIHSASIEKLENSFDIKPLIDYMKHHLHLQISLEDLEGRFSISASYLCKLFKRIYQTTPSEYRKLNKKSSLFSCICAYIIYSNCKYKDV